MTKSKKAFAELLVQAQGFGDADEIAKTMSLIDIIYAMKKAEEPKPEPPKKKKEPEPEPEPELEPKKLKLRDFWSRLTHDSSDED